MVRYKLSSKRRRILGQILDHPIISERYFFPRTVHIDQPTYVKTKYDRLGCWRSRPPGRAPVVLYFHGNGEVVGDWVTLLPSLCQSTGYDVFLSEYRGYGMSSGQPALYSMLGDLEYIARAVGVPPSQIVVFGRSVGSIYAFEWISRFPDTLGLVIESGIHDVYQRLRLRVDPDELGCTEEQMQEAVETHLNHHDKISSFRGPSLFMHARGDHLVSIDHAKANLDSALNGRLEVFNRGGHNDIFFANQRDYARVLKEFLNELKPGQS